MSNNSRYQGIWVVAEQNADGLTSVTYELLAKARQLKEEGQFDSPVTAVVLGYQLDGCQVKLAQAGAQAVIMVDHAKLKLFHNDLYAAILKQLVEDRRPDMILMGATAAGSDLAPTLGARLKTGVSAHCVDLHLNSERQLVAVVPAFGGKVLGDILCPQRRPQMATVRPGILGKAVCFDEQHCAVEVFDAADMIAADQGRVEALGIVYEPQQGMALEEAEVVIAGGFGVENSDNWALLEQAAALLGGAVGCTRPPLDEGWAQERQMIGTSGRSIRPKVYIGAGVSGAAHHICGIQDAGLMIGINKDAQSPLFECCDIGIAADLNEFLPVLIDVLQTYDDGVVC